MEATEEWRGRRPNDRASGSGCGIRVKPPGADPKTVPSLSVIEISAPRVTDNVRRGKKSKSHGIMSDCQGAQDKQRMQYRFIPR